MTATRERLAELAELAGSSPREQRVELLRRVCDLYFLTLDQQSEAERGVFGDVMQRLGFGLDPVARSELAQRLADTTTPPLALLRRLAEDDVMVARSVLERSPALDDATLIALIQTGSLARIDAISKRPQLSEHLCDAIIARGNDIILAQLAANPNAAISPHSLAKITERATKSEDLKSALATRDSLSGLQPGHMHSFSGLSEEWPLGEEAFSRDRDEARLTNSARSGDVPQSLQSLSRLTGLDLASVEHCLFRAELPALVVLCKANQLAAATFSALLQLRLAAGAISTKGIAGSMRQFEKMEPQMAQRIMCFLAARLASEVRKS